MESGAPGAAGGVEFKNNVMSLPQLTEIDSTNMSSSGKDASGHVNATKASSRAMPSVRHIRHNEAANNNPGGGYGSIGYNLNVKSECDMLQEDEYY